MPEPTITYKGYTSAQKGVIMEKLPDFHRPARRYEQNEVPGRSGAVMVDTGAYETYQTTMEVNVNGQDPHDIMNWLTGEGWLVSSDDAAYMAYCYLYPQADVCRFRVSASSYDTITVNMIVEPYRRLASESLITVTASGTTFAGMGHDACEPIVTVTGSGDIRLDINGEAVLIDDLYGSVIIDCDAGIAYKVVDGANVFMGQYISLEGEWPKLLPTGSTNTVSWTGTVTKVEIQPCWRYL